MRKKVITEILMVMLFIGSGDFRIYAQDSTKILKRLDKPEMKSINMENYQIRSKVKLNNPSSEDQPIHDLSPQIEISGFGDYYYRIRHLNTHKIGQFEVNLVTTIGEYIGIEAAIALQNERFGVGNFIVDFHLFGSEGYHFRPVSAIKHSGIMVGQFDVPFGLDWQVYPSIDRKLVSAPLVVEHTHDCWNDLGVQLYLENDFLNVVIYATNGFHYEEADENNNPIDMAVGGRIGIKLKNMIEIGTSYAGFLNRKNQNDMFLMGMDLQFKYMKFSFKGEYIAQGLGLTGLNSYTNNGFYFQGTYDLDKFFLVTRYDMFSTGAINDENLRRISIGGGWVILDGCQLRIENQLSSTMANTTVFQLVVGF